MNTKQIKSGYITGTNAQLQALRPFLVAQGFVDDWDWNDGQKRGCTHMKIQEGVFTITPWEIVLSPCLYTLSPDEDLEKAAQLIKQKFYE